MSYLEITDLSHGYGEKALYQQAQFSLYKGEHIGIVGPNGAGKSTLIGICAGHIIPDAGQVHWQHGLQVGYMDQYAEIATDSTILQFLQGAFAPLYALEAKMQDFYTRGAGGDADALSAAARCQSQLEAQDFYGIDLRLHRVATGLGLDAIGLERPIGQISGGQRAKVILAKLLLEEPQVLLLDEPTNFLDRQHITWLAEYLSASPNAFLVVSHDQSFLEKICTHICDIDNRSIRKYTGSFSAFQLQKQHLQADYLRRYETQRREIAKTEEYIRKNIAGVNSKNAKGRRKQLERVERMAAPEETQARPQFTFQAAPSPAQEQLVAKGLSIGYYYPLLPPVDLCISMGQKIALTGFNGIGKSTLLKTLLGQLPPLGGKVARADGLKIGYYAQDLLWDEPELSPVQILMSQYPAPGNKGARKQLFRCGINSQHAQQPIGTLSGGEQAKLKLCLLTLSPCSLLVLDEPTNHLDATAQEALAQALAQFPGTLLLVCHQERFYREWATRVLNIESLQR